MSTRRELPFTEEASSSRLSALSPSRKNGFLSLGAVRKFQELLTLPIGETNTIEIGLGERFCRGGSN
jgi:hypothetical protein